jgi:hypothetical protein
MNYNYLFTNKCVTVFRESDGYFTFKGVLRGKLYLMNFIPEEVEFDNCLIANSISNRGSIWGSKLKYRTQS